MFEALVSAAPRSGVVLASAEARLLAIPLQWMTAPARACVWIGVTVAGSIISLTIGPSLGCLSEVLFAVLWMTLNSFSW